jgi:hypothetical protein
MMTQVEYIPEQNVVAENFYKRGVKKYPAQN